MAQRIHLFGASGAGTSTLGVYLARAMGVLHLDADTYYWHETDPPFTRKRDPAQRVALIQRDIAGEENWILSGSLCSWGDPLLGHFTLAVFLYLDPAVRMARIAARENARYGDRIRPGGDMHAQHLDFMAWAGSYDRGVAPLRSFDLHERWMAGLPCPVLRLEAHRPVETLCAEVLRAATA